MPSLPQPPPRNSRGGGLVRSVIRRRPQTIRGVEIMAVSTHKPTSLNQQVMRFGFNVTDAETIKQTATARGEIQRLTTFAAAYDSLDPARREKVRAALADYLPAACPLSEIDALLGLAPEVPAVPTQTTTAATTTTQPVDAGKRMFGGQTPVAHSTGRKLPWIQSSQVSAKNGARYVNIGDARRTTGATVAEWEELLTTHRDALLAEIRKIGK